MLGIHLESDLRQENIGGDRHRDPQVRGHITLDEAALLGFAKSFRYSESVAALSAMSGVPITAVDRLMSGDRRDPILIIAKAIGLEWPTVRALVLLRLGPARIPASGDIENVRMNYMRLSPSTAERVVSFWSVRETA